MIIDGLIVGATVTIAALAIWGTSLLLRRDDTPPVDAGAHVNRLKYGNTWGAQSIRAQLITVGKLIEIAGQQAPWPHHQYPLTSPAAPLHLSGAGKHPGTTAAAAGTLPPAPPPLHMDGA